MGAKAGDAAIFNECLPKAAEFLAIGKQEKPSPKKSQPVSRLSW